MSLVNTIMGVMIAVILGVGVAVPVINDVVGSGNLSGTEALLAGFIPVLIIAAILYAVAQHF